MSRPPREISSKPAGTAEPSRPSARRTRWDSSPTCHAFLRSLVDQVTTGFGGKVAVAPRLFLRELTDILDRVDQHQDFDPAVHYKLALEEDRLRPEELAAVRGEAAPADEEVDESEAPGKGPRRLDG